MAESVPFKTYYGVELAQDLAAQLSVVYPAFPSRDFIERVAAQIEPLELKARVNVIAAELRRALPANYPQALAILLRILGPENADQDGMFNKGYQLLPLAQFVETYGLDHFAESTDALCEITKRNTAEYAIRPFILRHPDATMALLHRWVHHPNHHVRRLVSEGTRPRLPWALRLDNFVHDPEPTIALLEHLKNDPSLYVRKSVANHLNDIAKDHPKRVIALLNQWKKDATEDTLWIIRHALRTLVKKGDADALALLGYDSETTVKLMRFEVTPQVINVGDTLTLTLALQNTHAQPQSWVIDYAVHYVKANGKTSPKVFKWTTGNAGGGAVLELTKKHSFRPVTTRTYYAGKHRIEVQVNGQIVGGADFELKG